jgi:hypothetical protein
VLDGEREDEEGIGDPREARPDDVAVDQPKTWVSSLLPMTSRMVVMLTSRMLPPSSFRVLF